MNLVEQLQVKRAEANTRLQSRKRKLSELFAATACNGDLSNTAANQQYTQQLKAFHDANDLQKGRLFNESTLPPRPQIIRIQQPSPYKQSNADFLRPAENIRRSRSPTKKDASVPSNVQDLKSNTDNVASRLDDRNATHKNGEVFTVGGRSSPEINGAVGALSDGRSLATEKTSGIVRGSQESKQESDQARFNNTGPATANTQQGIDGAGGSLHHRDNADRQSSPSSSNRPGSTTPVPVAGSPNTSPGEEEAPLKPSQQRDSGKEDGSSIQNPPITPDTDGVHPIHKMSVSSIDIDMMDVDPTDGFDSPIKSTPASVQTPKGSSSQKPPIRIDTGGGQGSFILPSTKSAGIVETPVPITGSESPRHQSISTPVSAIDSTKRATRISSGALQKKSVSEILGETPKPSSLPTDTHIPNANKEAFASSSTQGRQADRERKERDRTKLSTVVFAKPTRVSDVEAIEVVSNNDVEKAKPEDRDYLYTLFESKAYSSKSGNLSHLIQHSHKTIMTTDHLVEYEYSAQCRVLKRLYQLQSADRWALRQRKRADEPPRPTSYWDFLLDHAKWMRTDFREERKWKYAAARALAESCAEWVASSAQQRKLLQIQVRPPHLQSKSELQDVDMEDEPVESSHPTPDLLPSGEDDSVTDDIADPREISLTNAPAAIFGLGAGDFNFVADRTPAFDKLINELPLYEPAQIEPDLAKSNLAERLDARWRTDIVPVSRFATEKLVIGEQKAPVRRSRYEYEIESSPPRKTKPLPPRQENVGLFMPENKHIRDRIHPGHSFRPPSEHPMPTQSFFETRSSSQWTAAEDDELRKLVKDFSYNWSLISSCLTSRSLYSSSPDRRTPWECFERWIGLEGMPTDMAKTPYFRTYSGRIEAAGRHVQAQLEEAQRRAGPSVPIPTRKRTTQPVRVDRKRASRHLAMLDAMRKLAKKREVHRQKQAHSADMAAMRKSNEVNQPRLGAKTPAEWSQLKHEREQKLAKQQELYRQQVMAHKRAATAQQRGGTSGPANGVLSGIPQAPGNIRVPPTGIPSTGMPNGQMGVPNGVPRPHPAMMGVPNGMQVPNGMAGPKGLPAQMQANIRGGLGNSPQQIRILNEAQKMHQEQLMRQAQQNGSHSSPNMPNVNMANGHAMNNPAFMAAMANANGGASPGGMSGNSGSPRATSMGQALSSGHVPVLAQIAATIKERHPTMTDDEVQRHATQQLTTWQQQATAAAAGQQQRPRVNQAALNAAMGAANAAANAGMAAAAANGGFPPNMTNEQLQQYNQRLRMQQQAQQHVARGMQGQLQPNMMGQMTNSPVMNISRPVSQHNNQGMSRSATPSNQRGGSASNVAPTSSSSTNVNGASPPVNGMPGQGSGQQGSPRPNQAQPMQT